MIAELSKGFKLPVFNMYDERTNPYDHLSHFNAVIVIYGSSDLVLYRLFPASLKGNMSA